MGAQWREDVSLKSEGPGKGGTWERQGGPWGHRRSVLSMDNPPTSEFDFVSNLNVLMSHRPVQCPPRSSPSPPRHRAGPSS